MTAATALKRSESFGYSFDIMAAFTLLETKRKMALYDLLMHGSIDGGANFRKTVEFLWPQASHKDAMYLEAFLRQRLNVY